MTRRADARGYLLAGALHGCVVWSTYAILEQALCVSSPVWRGAESAPGSSYWQVLAIVMISFAALGLGLGTASGLVLRTVAARRGGPAAPPSAERLRRGAVVTLSLASAMSWSLVRPFGKVEALSVAVSVAVAVGLVLCEARPAFGDRLGFLGNPWVAGLLMFGAGWTGRRTLDGSEHLVQFGGAAGTLLAIGLLGALGSRIWRRRRLPADSFLPVRAAAVAGIAGALVLGLGWFRPGPVRPLPRTSRSGSLPDRPNVILVTLDTVRADHLSLYGYERDTTPFLVKLAGEATVYDEAIAASNITLTSHASLFTGLYGSWHGAYMAPTELPQGRPLSERATTLAEILSANGYRTVSVVANYAYLGPGFGLMQGFQTSHLLAPAVASSQFLLRSHLSLLVDVLLTSDELGVKYCRAAEVNRVVSAELAQAHDAAVPFFLFVNYMDGHTPYVPPAPFSTMFPGRTRSLRTDDYLPMQTEVMQGRRKMSPEEHRHFVSQYDGAMRYLDSQLADLVARLKELDLYANSTIVITGDHGEAFGEHDILGHGSSVYQDQIHVPLIVKYPHQVHPRAVATAVSQTDVLPTILDVLGMGAPVGVQGGSLLKLGDDPSRAVLSESFPSEDLGARFMHTDRAVVAGRTKLVAKGAVGWELYDLSRDPGELDNRFAPDQAAAAPLAEHLRKWLEGKPAGGDRFTLDKETLRRLRSLGYMQ